MRAGRKARGKRQERRRGEITRPAIMERTGTGSSHCAGTDRNGEGGKAVRQKKQKREAIAMNTRKNSRRRARGSKLKEQEESRKKKNLSNRKRRNFLRGGDRRCKRGPSFVLTIPGGGKRGLQNLTLQG